MTTKIANVTTQELLERNLRSGMYSLGFNLLATAALDDRLTRSHIRVLGVIVWTMTHTGYSKPTRTEISFLSNVSLKRVSNILSDLSRYGYVRRIYADGHKAFTYAEVVNHEKIVAEITKFCEAFHSECRGKVPSRAGTLIPRVPSRAGTICLAPAHRL